MNIMLIGNGFDLAHYLPTAYSHFMGVMAAIEKMPDDKAEIKFEDLFGQLLLDDKGYLMMKIN